eukprot:CAMPEP_0114241978 /NCGR_PEP_ID=MMETSP0058-20121206/9921_1 /TAXON_ID=36894 /ORGANISM="Pyramimonas parkeae, CCMP726" /LENGTH=607 /DNA_ID=CAMNT_0001354541 /DNA_START=44 /DNA_END=1867 /DNA_ORIENTATION=+
MAQVPPPSAPTIKTSTAETSKIDTDLHNTCVAPRTQSVPIMHYLDMAKAATVDLQLADWDLQWHPEEEMVEPETGKLSEPEAGKQSNQRVLALALKLQHAEVTVCAPLPEQPMRRHVDVRVSAFQYGTAPSSAGGKAAMKSYSASAQAHHCMTADTFRVTRVRVQGERSPLADSQSELMEAECSHAAVCSSPTAPQLNEHATDKSSPSQPNADKAVLVVLAVNHSSPDTVSVKLRVSPDLVPVTSGTGCTNQEALTARQKATPQHAQGNTTNSSTRLDESSAGAGSEESARSLHENKPTSQSSSNHAWEIVLEDGLLQHVQSLLAKEYRALQHLSAMIVHIVTPAPSAEPAASRFPRGAGSDTVNASSVARPARDEEKAGKVQTRVAPPEIEGLEVVGFSPRGGALSEADVAKMERLVLQLQRSHASLESLTRQLQAAKTYEEDIKEIDESMFGVPIKGTLYKRRHKPPFTWDPTWIVITWGVAILFNSDDLQAVPQRMIRLTGHVDIAALPTDQANSRDHSFIVTIERQEQFMFAAKDKEDFDRWVKAFKIASATPHTLLERDVKLSRTLKSLKSREDFANEATDLSGLALTVSLQAEAMLQQMKT